MQSCSLALCLGNQFIAGAKARHQTAFFEQEDGTEGPREEDALDGGKCDHAFGKAGSGGVAPFKGPFFFPLYTCNGFDCPQKVSLLSWILDVHVDQKQVRFTVDVFNIR